MITWIQKTFGRHHKILLSLLLVVIAVSMIFIGSVPMGQISQKDQPKMFLGVNIADENAIQPLASAVSLSIELDTPIDRAPPQYGPDVFSRLIIHRIIQQHFADAWQIPQPAPADVENYIRSRQHFQNPFTREFDPSIYDAFKIRLSTQPNAAQQLVLDTFRENWRLERVTSLLDGPGYALPYPAEVEAAIQGTSWNLDIATLDIQNFKPALEPTDAMLREIFDRDPEQFRLPPQLSLQYIKFPATPGEGTPTRSQLLEFIDANPDLFSGVNPDVPGEQTDALIAAWRLDQGAPAAGARASEFVSELDKLGHGPGTPEFAALLQKYNVTLQPLPPLLQGRPAPLGLPVPPVALQQALRTLNAQNYFSNALRASDGAVVVFFNGLQDARVPTFEEARAEVAAQFANEQKGRELNAKGQALQQSLAASVAAGQPFAKAAEALGLKVRNYPDFTMQTFPEDLSPQLTAALFEARGGAPFLFTLPMAAVSPMLAGSQEAILVHVASRKSASPGADSPLVKMIQSQLARGEELDNRQAAMKSLEEQANALMNENASGDASVPPPG